VQGLEPDVLAGARASLRRVAGIQLELSLVPLYRRETPMLRMLAQLERAGFALMSLEYGFCNPFTARMLQVDGVLFRPSMRSCTETGGEIDHTDRGALIRAGTNREDHSSVV